MSKQEKILKISKESDIPSDYTGKAVINSVNTYEETDVDFCNHELTDIVTEEINFSNGVRHGITKISSKTYENYGSNKQSFVIGKEKIIPYVDGKIDGDVEEYYDDTTTKINPYASMEYKKTTYIGGRPVVSYDAFGDSKDETGIDDKLQLKVDLLRKKLGNKVGKTGEYSDEEAKAHIKITEQLMKIKYQKRSGLGK
ncbi:MAG: hypothetical protein IJ545_04535 [Alphaproteobacteria bacterium]|nr:hypothetical protein [Alphaproteobacteria bacterium]